MSVKKILEINKLKVKNITKFGTIVVIEVNIEVLRTVNC